MIKTLYNFLLQNVLIALETLISLFYTCHIFTSNIYVKEKFKLAEIVTLYNSEI